MGIRGTLAACAVGGTIILCVMSLAHAADFDADNDSDVLVRKGSSGAWSLLEVTDFTMVGNFTLSMFVGENWTHQTNANFNSDAVADVLLRRNDGVWRLFQTNNHAVVGSGPINLFQNTDWVFQSAFDFDSDGDADVLARKTSDGQWRIFEIQNLQVLSSAGVPIFRNALWSFQGASDFDGDGDGDILLRNANNGLWRIFEIANRAVVGSAGPGALFNGSAWDYVTSGDMDRDGHSEIVLRNNVSGDWRVFRVINRVVSGVASLSLFAGQAWGFAQSGDFDADGDTDVLLRRTDSGLWRFFEIENRASQSNTPGNLFQNTDFTVQDIAPRIAEDDSAAAFRAIQENVFTPSCALGGCHSGPNPAAGQDLSAGSAFTNIVEVASAQQPNLFRVDPGNPNASYLIRKLEGGPSISNDRMPLAGCCLSQETIDEIREWISNLPPGGGPPPLPPPGGY